jgi:hypothetical protein
MSNVAPWPARAQWAQADGTLTPEANRWLQRQLLERVGGSDAMTNQDLELLSGTQPAAGQAPPDAFADSLLLPAPVGADGAAAVVDDQHARVQALEAEVQRLARLIHDLQLGYQL